MNLSVGQVWRNTEGVLVLITNLVKMADVVYYYTGETQRGDRGNYNLNGTLNSLSKKSALTERVFGFDKDNFKVFTVGSLWVTPGGRVWEVVAISRDEEYPIIANELLPDNSFHANIKRFDWGGEPHDGSATVLWKKCS